MAVVRFTGFSGENRAIHPALLGDTACTVSNNQKPGRSDLRPWRSPLTVATVPVGRKTIYRMGRDVASDTDFWLSWTTPVHAVRGFNSADTGERTYFTGSGAPKWTDTIKALATAPYPTSSRDLGVPAPSGIPTLTASGGSGTTFKNASVLYTYITDINEESAPSAPSTVLNYLDNATVTIGNIAPPPAGAHGINRVRVYRTQDSSGAGQFYFVRDIPTFQTSVVDDQRAVAEPLATLTWLSPPADLRNLTGLWNGMIAGISGRTVRFCEAFVPYAWPLAYEIEPVKNTPLALGAYAQTLVVLTDGYPLIVSGGSPDSMDEQPLDFLQPLVSAASMVSTGYGVVWASPDGLCYVGQGGARVVTEGLMTKDDWRALNPSSILGCMYERRYIGFYTVASVTKGFVIDPMDPSGIFFFDMDAAAVYFDPLQVQLYTLSGGNIQKWDAGALRTATVRSKLFRAARPTPAYSCAQVIADSYPATFRLYADGALKHTQVVLNANPFRLPAGYHCETTQIELATDSQILYCAAAHSVEELAQT